ncbi:hypothetical protein RUND412_011556, partial [Rhizina undulata]
MELIGSRLGGGLVRSLLFKCSGSSPLQLPEKVHLADTQLGYKPVDFPSKVLLSILNTFMVFVKISALPALLFAITSLAAPAVDPQTSGPNNANPNDIPNPNVYSNNPSGFLPGPVGLYPGAGYIPDQTLNQPAPIAPQNVNVPQGAPQNSPQNAPQIYPQGTPYLNAGVDNLLGPYGYGGFNSFDYGAYSYSTSSSGINTDVPADNLGSDPIAAAADNTKIADAAVDPIPAATVPVNADPANNGNAVDANTVNAGLNYGNLDYG